MEKNGHARSILFLSSRFLNLGRLGNITSEEEIGVFSHSTNFLCVCWLMFGVHVLWSCVNWLCFNDVNSTPPSKRDRRLRDSGFFPKTLEASLAL